MSKLFKILIPLINGISQDDLTNESGFIDAYTMDDDKPFYGKTLYIAYDNRIRTKQSIATARKFETHPNLKGSYVKYCNGVPYYIYVLWVPPIFNNILKGCFYLDAKEKFKILQFWGTSEDTSKEIMNNSLFCLPSEYKIPLEDYNDYSKLVVIKQKAVAS